MAKQIVYLTETDLNDIVSNTLYRIMGRVPLSDGIHNIENRKEIIRYAPIIWKNHG